MAITASVTATARRNSTKPRAPRPRPARWSSSISTWADPELSRHFDYLETAVAEARTAMLSRKKAMLAAHLIDAFADRLFTARNEPAGDILAFRSELAAAHPALGLVFDLVAGRAALVVEAVEVPLSEYGKLSVEDFMVSLYNQHTVQRVRIVTADGRREDVHVVLVEAVAALR